MKNTIKICFVLVLTVLILSNMSFAGRSYVRGYTRSNGTYVSGYYRNTGSSSKPSYSSSYSPKSYSSGRVNVKGYTRKDGTKVRPHSRSKPDGIKSNNYGSASSKQRKEWKNLPVLPSYKNDYDNDGLPNRIDMDDDNDGVCDDLDNKSNKVYSTKEMKSDRNPLGENCDFWF